MSLGSGRAIKVWNVYYDRTKHCKINAYILFLDPTYIHTVIHFVVEQVSIYLYNLSLMVCAESLAEARFKGYEKDLME